VKRVLMLAYFFPPSKAAGTFRTLRFVRGLPASGWQPSVLSVRPETYSTIELDFDLLHKVPDTVRVARTPAPPLHRTYKRIQGQAKQWLRRGRRSDTRPIAAPSPITTAAATGKTDLLYQLCRTPDVDAGWYGYALVWGLLMIARERPDVLYATGGPWTTFLVARDLARLTRIPLVLDYRDPWTANPAVWRAGNGFETLALRLEKTVLRQAHSIVANTDVLRETLITSHGDEVGRRTVVIHNSFDAADYEAPEPVREAVFTLSYVGALYDAHNPDSILRAVEVLIERRPDLRRRFRLRLVGAGAPRVAAQVRALGLEDVIVVQEPVAHAEAVRLQRAAHALLLLLTVPSDHSTFVPSKLYEYIAARRPLFAVTGGGALDRLLRSRQLTPWIYRPEDIDAMVQGLLHLYERYERDCLPEHSDATVRSFSGAAATSALAGVLEAAAARHPLEPVVVPEAQVEAPMEASIP